MANRIFFHPWTLDREVVELFGAVTIGGSGAVSSQTSYGFTVTRSNTGIYVATLADKYPELLYANMTTLLAAGADHTTQMTAQDMTAGTITFNTRTGGSVADPASGSVLYLRIVLKNSNVGP